jgi:flagellar protein FliO/FliZ
MKGFSHNLRIGNAWRLCSVLGHKKASFAALLIVLLTSLPVTAETRNGLPASPLDSGAILQTVVGLGLVIGLSFAVSWLFRRFGKLPISGKGVVTILGGVSLGPRERAVVLQVGQTRLLVGVAPGRVQTLHVLESEVGEARDFTGQLAAEMADRQ